MPPRPMAPATAPMLTDADIASAPYSLAIFSEYAHVLDSIPLDLSRSFADLRELDAVLLSTMSSITAKITRLTELVEDKSSSKFERLWLLCDIAEEAGRLKAGGDDKIRVASNASDTLNTHHRHLIELIKALPDPSNELLVRKTTYPHVAPDSFKSNTGDNGRRRMPRSTGLLHGPGEASPTKRRKVNQDEDVEYGRTPRKEKGGEANARQPRNAQRTKKADRAVSPTESLVSVASHIPTAIGTGTSHNRTQSTHARANAQSTNSKQRRSNLGASQVTDASRDVSLLDTVISRKDAATHSHNNGAAASTSGQNSSSNAAAAHTNGHGHERSTSARGHGHSRTQSNAHNNHNNANNASADWSTANANGDHDASHTNGAASRGGGGGGGTSSSAQNGLTVVTKLTPVRSVSPPAQSGSASPAPRISNPTAVDGGEEVEIDDGQYCICNRGSFGQMIACDDANCVTEWFHLACIGLTDVPEGDWVCEWCLAKRSSRRNQRSTKKKAGGRGNARSSHPISA